MKKTKVDLILPQTTVIFCGDSQTEKRRLKGKLRISTTQPIYLTKVEVCYKAKTHLHWKDEDAHGNLFASRMTASRELRKSSQVLLKQFTLRTGTTELDFELFIPSYLCPSFQSQYCDISHIISAHLIVPSKLLLSAKKHISIEKKIQVKKTCIPKEVIMNILPLPNLVMTGERANFIQWLFQTPSSVPLLTSPDGQLEFKGLFKRANNETITLNKIQIDVMQEELYYYDVSCTEIKRRLITGNTTPSIYIEPPLDTVIPFSFPLNNCKFSASIDSPFLKIRHFIRVILNINHCTSICIGLPFQVTPKIHVDDLLLLEEQHHDGLPSYEYVIQQGEPLPIYKRRNSYRRSPSSHNSYYSSNSSSSSSSISSQYNVNNITIPPNLVELVDQNIDQLQQQEIRRTTATTTIDKSNIDYDSCYSSSSSLSTIAEIINVGERSMKGFCAII